MTKATKSAKTQRPKSTSDSKVAQEKVVKRSAADFFQDNKAIAGFDNTMRVVFTSIRELVENGLDAAERVGHLPEIRVIIQRLSRDEIAKLLNITQFDSSDKIDFLRLTVRDNGSGIQSEFVPPLFGRVLTGSNYGARQSRGRFGLGAKMVLLNAMSSVDLPLVIKSKHLNEDFTSYHELMINLAENEPIIINRREVPQGTTEAIPNSGTEVSVTFTGAWGLAARYVYEYFSQLALITPYASFYIQYPDSDVPVEMERVVEEMPPYPQIAKVHPWGTDITQFKRELAVTRVSTMEQFLQEHFQGIGAKTAKDFLEFVGIQADKSPDKLEASEIRRIVHEGFVMPDSDPKKRRTQKYFPFKRPSGDSLAPLGENLLAKGIEKELTPQFVRAASGDVSAYSGHPFVIEAALAYGGPNLSGEIGSPRIYRFANRIPLLFGAGNDIITKCVQKMNWKNYKISINKSPIAIVVSVVSSKIPFPETSKEYIADVDELREEINRVLRKLARGLSQHLGRAERERREKQRQSRFESAAPKVLRNLMNIVKDTPFILESHEEVAKLEKALASAVPRLVRRKYPPSPAISSIGEWLPTETYGTLVENDFQTIFQFLRASNVELSKITGFGEDRIDDIKRRTVNDQERSKQAPLMREFEIFNKNIEDDFSKYRDMLRIHKAFNKRWIVSSLDLFATPVSQLRYIEGFPEKLIYDCKSKAVEIQLKHSSSETIAMENAEWMTDNLLKNFRKAKIDTLFDYIIGFPEKLAQIPSLNRRLIEWAKDEIKGGIKAGYIDPESVIGAASFDWMDYKVTPRLRGRKISKIKEFLQTPSETLAELPELAENLILRSKQLFKDKLEDFNDPDSLMAIPGISESMQSDLTRLEIRGLVDFLLKGENELHILRGFTNQLINMKLDEIYEEIIQNHEAFPIKNALWLDPDLESQLKSFGINYVYDFVKTASSELEKIKGMDPHILRTIKSVYGTPIPFFTPDEMISLESKKIFCLEELYTAINNQLLPSGALGTKAKDLLDILSQPICFLPVSGKYYLLFHNLGVSRIFDLLIWNDADLHKTTKVSYQVIDQIKSTLSLDQIRELIEEKSIPISALAGNLKGKEWTSLLESGSGVQALYYALPYSNRELGELNLTDKMRKQLARLFRTPVTNLPQIKSKWVSRLHSNGISTFIELISWPREELVRILGRERSFVDNLFSEFPPFRSGMPLISLGVFSATEMKTLRDSGFETVEDVYFGFKKELFSIMGVKWKKIERYQRRLETPIAMLQLATTAEGSKIRISHAGIERLATNAIDQIIKLVYWDNPQLKTILKMSDERVQELKRSIAIKEEGMPLGRVSGFTRKVAATLTGYGIETVEDLYFSASEDMLDEEDDLQWDVVKKAMEALDLPISYLTGVIPDDYLEKLIGKRIDTIIRFLITSPEELSSVLGTPIDNIENFQQKINLINLRESAETSISILDGLKRKDIATFANEGILTVFDFLTSPDEQISSVLAIDVKKVESMKKDIHFSSIETIKEEKMIPLSSIAIFDRKTVKKLARLGIESLSDLYYVATSKNLEESPVEWQEILDARIVLDMPLIASSEVSHEEIEILRKAKIVRILDLMMDTTETLEKRTKLSSDRIEAIKKSINFNEILSLIKSLSSLKLDFPPDYKRKIQTLDLQTVYDLLAHPDPEFYLGKLNDRAYRIDSTNWESLFSVLSIPISLILGLDPPTIKLLNRKQIRTMRDALVASEARLEGVEGIEPTEFISDLKALSFSEIFQFKQIPMVFIPNLPTEFIFPLIDNKITRVDHLLDASNSDVAAALETSSTRIRKILSNLSMSTTIKSMEDNSTPLDQFSSLVSKSTLQKLSNIGISTIQELYLHDREQLSFNGLSELFAFLDLPINRLSTDIPTGDLRKLSQYGINTLFRWFFIPNPNLSKILGMEISEIAEIKKEFDPETASSAKLSETDVPLKAIVETGYIDFDELEKLGIRTLEDMLFANLETLECSDKLKKRLNNLIDAANSSLAYYSLLDPTYVMPLAFNGITSVKLLIQSEFSQIRDNMGILDENEYNTARSSVNLVNILTHKKTESEFRVKLSSLRAFTPKQLEVVQKLGIDNVVDLYFLLDPDKSPKSVASSVDSVKRVLEKPFASLTSISAPNLASKVALLFNAGITSIIEFLFWPKSDLAELLEIKRYELNRFRKINLGDLRRKKLGTPLENFVRVPEEYIEPLNEYGIDFIEDLYFYLKRYPTLIPGDMIPGKILNEWIKDLDSPIVRLAGLPIPVTQELITKGVNRIIDFLYWPVDELKQVYGLSETKIKSIKKNVRLRRKTDVLGQLDKFMGE
ncbi:MAG: DNA topoisomerase VI subunit B [Candidatus Heimdallarchaeota archaeon]